MATNSAAYRRATIIRANNIARELASFFSEDVRFFDMPKGAAFAAVDPVTGESVFEGSYVLNRRNIVIGYQASYTFDQGTVSTAILLNGTRNAFYKHAYAMKYSFENFTDANPVFASLFAETILDNGQGFADLIDRYPGADSFDPASTIVTSPSGQYWFA